MASDTREAIDLLRTLEAALRARPPDTSECERVHAELRIELEKEKAHMPSERQGRLDITAEVLDQQIANLSHGTKPVRECVRRAIVSVKSISIILRE